MGTGLRFPKARKAARRILNASLLLSGILFAPARSQESLQFLTPQRHPDGGRIEIRTPDGLDCNSYAGDKPSLNIGAGVTKPSVLQGHSGMEYFTPTKIGPPEPVFGIGITIPFGSQQKNCDALISYEEASTRIRKAQELYELGLISEAELKDVGRKAYAALVD